jgi:hypothetical protein
MRGIRIPGIALESFEGPHSSLRAVRPGLSYELVIYEIRNNELVISEIRNIAFVEKKIRAK